MNTNPYNPPLDAGAVDAVDRRQRDGLVAVIRQFLEEQTTAFELDEALDEYQDAADPAVRFVAGAVWYFYDDCDDHVVTLAKPEWDYFQRLLLLLESDRQIVIRSTRRWSWTQLLAGMALAGFAGCVWQFGWGTHLLVFSIPFGVVSIFISWVRNRSRLADLTDQLLTPFASYAELSTTYKSTAGFAKHRYPRSLTRRRIRSRVAEFGVGLQMYAGWLMLAPIPLLVQLLPLTETHTSVSRLAATPDEPDAI